MHQSLLGCAQCPFGAPKPPKSRVAVSTVMLSDPPGTQIAGWERLLDLPGRHWCCLSSVMVGVQHQKRKAHVRCCGDKDMFCAAGASVTVRSTIRRLREQTEL